VRDYLAGAPYACDGRRGADASKTFLNCCATRASATDSCRSKNSGSIWKFAYMPTIIGPLLRVLQRNTTKRTARWRNLLHIAGAALDVSVQATILELLIAQKERTSCAYLLISHDLAVVRQIADDVVVLRDGAVQDSGPVERVFVAPVHPYTRALLEAVPSLPLNDC
jgi:hypothetical protein